MMKKKNKVLLLAMGLGTACLAILLGAATLYFSPDEIIKQFKLRLERDYNLGINADHFNFSLWHGFTITTPQVYLLATQQQKKILLFRADEINLSYRLNRLFHREFILHHLQIKRPIINLQQVDGQWNFSPPSPPTPPPVSSTPLKKATKPFHPSQLVDLLPLDLQIKEVAFTNARFSLDTLVNQGKDSSSQTLHINDLSFVSKFNYARNGMINGDISLVINPAPKGQDNIKLIQRAGSTAAKLTRLNLFHQTDLSFYSLQDLHLSSKTQLFNTLIANKPIKPANINIDTMIALTNDFRTIELEELQIQGGPVLFFHLQGKIDLPQSILTGFDFPLSLHLKPHIALNLTNFSGYPAALKFLGSIGIDNLRGELYTQDLTILGIYQPPGKPGLNGNKALRPASFPQISGTLHLQEMLYEPVPLSYKPVSGTIAFDLGHNLDLIKAELNLVTAGLTTPIAGETMQLKSDQLGLKSQLTYLLSEKNLKQGTLALTTKGLQIYQTGRLLFSNPATINLEARTNIKNRKLWADLHIDLPALLNLQLLADTSDNWYHSFEINLTTKIEKLYPFYSFFPVNAQTLLSHYRFGLTHDLHISLSGKIDEAKLALALTQKNPPPQIWQDVVTFKTAFKTGFHFTQLDLVPQKIQSDGLDLNLSGALGWQQGHLDLDVRAKNLNYQPLSFILPKAQLTLKQNYQALNASKMFYTNRIKTNLAIPYFGLKTAIEATHQVAQNKIKDFKALLSLKLDNPKAPPAFNFIAIGGKTALDATVTSTELETFDLNAHHIFEQLNLNLDLSKLIKVALPLNLSPHISLRGLDARIPLKQTITLAAATTSPAKVKVPEPVNFMHNLQPETEIFMDGQKSFIRINAIDALGIPITNFSLTLAILQQMIDINHLQLNIFDGQMLGNFQMMLEPDARTLKCSLHFSGLDIKRFFRQTNPQKLDGTNPKGQKLFGNLNIAFNLTTKELNGFVSLTQIGADQTRKILDFVDPAKINPNIQSMKNYLNFVAPKQLTFKFNKGFLAISLEFEGVTSLLIKELHADRIPVTTILQKLERKGP